MSTRNGRSIDIIDCHVVLSQTQSVPYTLPKTAEAVPAIIPVRAVTKLGAMIEPKTVAISAIMTAVFT